MKRKWLLVIGSLAIVGIIGAILIYVFVYNKPHPDYAEADPDFRITATELFTEFQNNTTTANDNYNGKIVAVRGELSSVETTELQTIAVFAIDEGMFGDEGIRMSMLPEYSDQVSQYTPGSNIVIKGFCSGYNGTDVILEHCSIEE
jgi:hypothetical protein